MGVGRLPCGIDRRLPRKDRVGSGKTVRLCLYELLSFLVFSEDGGACDGVPLVPKQRVIAWGTPMVVEWGSSCSSENRILQETPPVIMRLMRLLRFSIRGNHCVSTMGV